MSINKEWKSLLTKPRRSIAVDHIRETCETIEDSKTFVACIYINYKEKDTQSIFNILAAVWRQLVQCTGNVTDDVNVLYNDNIKRDVRISSHNYHWHIICS